MGFLDRAKKLAELAKEKAETALADARARSASTGSGGSTTSATATGDPQFGTPYVPGMLGRPGWRERGLQDPAAVLPVAARERAGIPHSTKSTILEQPFGVGRRWSSGERSAGLYYRLDPEHNGWTPPGDLAPFAGVAGASATTLEDGRLVVLLAAGQQHVVLEVSGLDDAAVADVARAVAEQLQSGKSN